MTRKITAALATIALAMAASVVYADEDAVPEPDRGPQCNACNGGGDACAFAEGCDPCDGMFRRLLGDAGCDAYGGCCGKPKLLGLFTASDCRFTDFISPMTNPVFFEDPRNLTEARVIFLNHQIPGSVLGGGDVQLLATEFRAAITDRLSIIATKDGYIFAGNDAPPINGWANVNAGLKYNLYADPAQQRLISLGTRLEMPVGSYRALQGNSGTGVFDLFLTGGTQLGDLSHVVSAAGFRLPAYPNIQNEQFYWSLHFDRRMQNRPIYGLMEFNWYHWMSNVAGGLPVEGLDLYNFGSSNVAGTNIVTGAVGVKYKPSPNSEIGVCWEVPLTVQRDIIDNRITADLILRY
jgi:hypothetical protein